MDPEKLTPQQFALFKDLIYRHSGIRVDESKITLVSNRIRRRLREHKLDCFDAYHSYLTSREGFGEMAFFLDEITTNETHFFRTQSHFDWFKGDFITEQLALERAGQRRDRKLRIWSAACSTGEEVYSLGICLAENGLRLKGWESTIVGTDLSDSVLKDAREGVYRQRSLEHVSEQQLKRYFDADMANQTWSVRSIVRQGCEFGQHNLMEPMRQPLFDCIFIRNVLIYFDRESKAVVIKHLMNALNRGGYLVVGPSEGIYDMLEPLQKRQTFLYQKI